MNTQELYASWREIVARESAAIAVSPFRKKIMQERRGVVLSTMRNVMGIIAVRDAELPEGQCSTNAEIAARIRFQLYESHLAAYRESPHPLEKEANWVSAVVARRALQLLAGRSLAEMQETNRQAWAHLRALYEQYARQGHQFAIEWLAAHPAQDIKKEG